MSMLFFFSFQVFNQNIGLVQIRIKKITYTQLQDNHGIPYYDRNASTFNKIIEPAYKIK